MAKLPDGRVGYLHIPDMGAPGICEFIKWYYPQIRKEGLIVDVRGNGGGNVSQMVIERLRRKLLGTRFGRTSEYPGTYPRAPCSTATWSASSTRPRPPTATSSPHMFRKAGLGPADRQALVGRRRRHHRPRPADRRRQRHRAASSGTQRRGRQWIIEGHGVDPDIVVENDPKSVIDGRDPQLERAVAEVLKAWRREPMQLPKRPADPVKTK